MTSAYGLSICSTFFTVKGLVEEREAEVTNATGGDALTTPQGGGSAGAALPAAGTIVEVLAVTRASYTPPEWAEETKRARAGSSPSARLSLCGACTWRGVLRIISEATTGRERVVSYLDGVIVFDLENP